MSAWLLLMALVPGYIRVHTWDHSFTGFPSTYFGDHLTSQPRPAQVPCHQGVFGLQAVSLPSRPASNQQDCCREQPGGAYCAERYLRQGNATYDTSPSSFLIPTSLLRNFPSRPSGIRQAYRHNSAQHHLRGH